MSYKELEDTVGKWLSDLEEQEKAFLRQAAQVNSWDKQLIDNGERITEIHNEVSRVKVEQQRLDRELDFILSQQEELEGILTPIEDQLKLNDASQPTLHSDIEREKTYKLAESIDCQLKRMMQDLKDIIEHINNANNNQVTSQSGGEDPMTQIAKILNSHMDSLQWVDQSSAGLQKRVEDVSRLMEARKRDQSLQYELDR